MAKLPGTTPAVPASDHRQKHTVLTVDCDTLVLYDTIRCYTVPYSYNMLHCAFANGLAAWDHTSSPCKRPWTKAYCTYCTVLYMQK